MAKCRVSSHSKVNAFHCMPTPWILRGLACHLTVNAAPSSVTLRPLSWAVLHAVPFYFQRHDRKLVINTIKYLFSIRHKHRFSKGSGGDQTTTCRHVQENKQLAHQNGLKTDTKTKGTCPLASLQLDWIKWKFVSGLASTCKWIWGSISLKSMLKHDNSLNVNIW